MAPKTAVTERELKRATEARILKVMEEHPDLPDWLYLLHHVQTDEKTGEERLLHCSVVDHLGNLYEIEHATDENGEVRHILAGLLDDQEAYWSDAEAEADGESVPCANRQLAG